MTLAEVAAATGAELPVMATDMTVSSVEFDSRRVTPGALFVALPGEHVDGHDFAAQAAAAGAVAVLGARPVPELPTLVAPAGIGDGRPGGDVLAALQALARHVAARLTASGLTVVGVTGSAGKTSTKDMIAAVLSRAGTVVAPPGSFNNELGHPYTVLRAEPATDYLVLELSARGVGHIASLATVAPPRIGAVLNVGSAHLGEFGSRAAIARAKGELVEALPAAIDGGVAILNADDPLVAAMATRTSAAVVSTSTTRADADVRARGVRIDDAARASFELATDGASAPVRLRVVGAHQVANALAAAAVGRAVGMEVSVVAEALSAAEPASPWRMAVSELAGGVTLINDAYNANPESTRTALSALARIGRGRRTWAVLGEMAELGDGTSAAHVEIGRTAAELGAHVVAIGSAGMAIADGAGPAGSWVADRAAALRMLTEQLRPHDVVLVKASRAVGLERLATELAEALPSILAGRDPGSDRSGEGHA